MSKVKCFAVRIVFTLGLSTSSVTLADAEWPCWQGPNHDGKSSDTGLLKEWPDEGPKLLWQVNGIGNGFSTVSVSNGQIYTTGDVDDECAPWERGPVELMHESGEPVAGECPHPTGQSQQCKFLQH